MKKTFIALLLVLAIVSVNVFAEDTTATINITAGVEGVALFGVSEAALVPADFLSETAFRGKTLSTITKGFDNLTSLQTVQTVGYLSGFNTTVNKVTIGVSVSPLKNTTNTGASEIALTVTPSENQEIAAAGTTAGTLPSVAITAIATTPANIDIAPAGAYEATVTFTIVTE